MHLLLGGLVLLLGLEALAQRLVGQGRGHVAADQRLLQLLVRGDGDAVLHLGVLLQALGAGGGGHGLLRDELVHDQREKHLRRGVARLGGQVLRRVPDIAQADLLAVHPGHHRVRGLLGGRDGRGRRLRQGGTCQREGQGSGQQSERQDQNREAHQTSPVEKGAAP